MLESSGRFGLGTQTQKPSRQCPCPQVPITIPIPILKNTNTNTKTNTQCPCPQTSSAPLLDDSPFSPQHQSTRYWWQMQRKRSRYLNHSSKGDGGWGSATVVPARVSQCFPAWGRAEASQVQGWGKGIWQHQHQPCHHKVWLFFPQLRCCGTSWIRLGWVCRPAGGKRPMSPCSPALWKVRLATQWAVKIIQSKPPLKISL